MAVQAPTEVATSSEEALVNLRSTLDWLGGDVHHIEQPVDPVLERTAITKAFDGSKVLVADNVTGYPRARMYSNLYATPERMARVFGVDSYKDVKHAILDAYAHPIPPNIIDGGAPCHEVVVAAEEIDEVTDILPIVLHTPEDGGRIFGSGRHLLDPPGCPGTDPDLDVPDGVS
ncbi:MAG: UbiD family decarboxylase [Actinomycetia bacterium]|nr:UbiD family decarboxylase [Actinomycetes bacterium]